jgi:hypothetical protein
MTPNHANSPEGRPITLDQFARALAAHALLTVYPHELEGFFAPERAEELAQFIISFAQGAPVARAEPTP